MSGFYRSRTIIAVQSTTDTGERKHPIVEADPKYRSVGRHEIQKCVHGELVRPAPYKNLVAFILSNLKRTGSRY